VQVSLVINPLSGVQGITADGVRQFAAHTLNSTSGRHFSKSSGLSESSDQRTPVVQYRTKPEPPTDLWMLLIIFPFHNWSRMMILSSLN
jgi:hypothetical protein